jgi:hypothetical protein
MENPESVKNVFILPKYSILDKIEALGKTQLKK